MGLLLALTVLMSVFAGPVQRYTAAAAAQLGDRAAYGRAVLGDNVQTTRPYRFDAPAAPSAPEAPR
jgi:multicomponent K+:H+ antiporter subunit D